MIEGREPSSQPLVSVGIPTYNRAEKLRRAAASVLEQTYPNLELFISDDGSTDQTPVVCEELRERDARVRCTRTPSNLGLAANYNAVIQGTRGEYVMMLSDDDWLAPDYVERCVNTLRAKPDHVLVAGLARYFDSGRSVRDGISLNLEQRSARERVVSYLEHVDENGLFSGIMPRRALVTAAPMRNVLGNDWLLLSAVLAQGKAATLTDTHVFRELGGTSADVPKLVRAFGLPSWQARLPHVAMSLQVLVDVLERNSAFAAIALRERLPLAIGAAIAVLDWRADLWHLTMPTFATLGGRRGGRWIWRCYLRLTRLAGATHAGIKS